MYATERARDDRYARLAFAASLVGHLAFVYIMLVKPFVSEKLPSVIYSVTMETGATKGGVAQNPDPKNKSAVVPHKKVSQEQPEEKKAEPEKTKPEPEKKVESKPEEKPEVIIPDEKKEKVEPKKTEPDPKKAVTNPVEKPKVETKKPETKPVAKQVAPDPNQNYQKALQRYLGASTNAGGQGFGAAGGIGKGMGGGILKSPEWFAYKARLEAHVKQGWNWHDPKVQLLAKVRFRISPQGVVSDVRLLQSSGNTAYDDAAMRCVSRSSPVPAASAAIYPDFADVVVDFTP